MPSAAILAGGRARRFEGRDKGALVIEGRAIFDRQLSELASITSDILLVGYRGTAPSTQVRMVPDRTPGAGPLGGLDAALAAARHDQIAVLGCDMPYVPAALLRHLLTLAAFGDADVVVPQTERGYHPLCAVYARSCAAAVRRRIAERRLRVIDLFTDVRVRVVAGEELTRFGDPHRLLANVNTPGDYDALGPGDL